MAARIVGYTGTGMIPPGDGADGKRPQNDPVLPKRKF